MIGIDLSTSYKETIDVVMRTSKQTLNNNSNAYVYSLNAVSSFDANNDNTINSDVCVYLLSNNNNNNSDACMYSLHDYFKANNDNAISDACIAFEEETALNKTCCDNLSKEK